MGEAITLNKTTLAGLDVKLYNELGIDHQGIHYRYIVPASVPASLTEYIIGKVFTEPERDDGTTFWQMWAKPDASEWNTVVGIQNPAFEISSGDYVEVKGTVTGKFEAENAFGAEITGVTIRADNARVVTALEAASPPTETLGAREAIIEATIRVKVEKIELADDETRVFIAVRNDSDAKISIYQHTAKLVTGGSQHDPEFTPDGYPELPSDIVPGANASGVIVFPRIDPDFNVRLSIEAYSSDIEIGEYGSATLTFNWP